MQGCQRSNVPFETTANDPDVLRIRRNDTEEFAAKGVDSSTNKQYCPYRVISFLSCTKSNENAPFFPLILSLSSVATSSAVVLGPQVDKGIFELSIVLVVLDVCCTFGTITYID